MPRPDTERHRSAAESGTPTGTLHRFGYSRAGNCGVARRFVQPMIESADRSRYDPDDADGTPTQEACTDDETDRAGSLPRPQPAGDSRIQPVHASWVGEPSAS